MGAEAEKSQQPPETQLTAPTTAPNPNPNSITEAQFATWKLRKDADSSDKKAEAERKRAEDIAAGLVQMNGRELFMHEPSVFDNERY